MYIYAETTSEIDCSFVRIPLQLCAFSKRYGHRSHPFPLHRDPEQFILALGGGRDCNILDREAKQCAHTLLGFTLKLCVAD
jgi:hypothetical protein